MTNFLFQSKAAKVLIAEPAGTLRMTMTAVLRALGFAEVAAVPTLEEAHAILVRGDTHWLITALFAEDKLNALQLLRTCHETPALKDVLVSLWLTQAEETVVSRAYALGAFSTHAKPFTKETFKVEVTKLLATNDELQGEGAFVAASIFRNRLRTNFQFDELLELETSLCKAFPDQPRLLLNMAECCFEMGDDQRARALLWQAEQRDPALATAAQTLGDQYLGADSDRRWTSLKPGVCAVVDPDDAAGRAAQEALAACNATDVRIFQDGDAFWQWLVATKEKPELIVMEWRIPKVTGPTLIQRMRAHGIHLPLIVVNSSLVKRKDQSLLEEMGVAAVLEKPSKRNDILNCIAWAVSQARRPTEERSYEVRIRALLAEGEVDEAAKHMQAYVAKSDPASPVRKHLEAEFAFAVGDFAAARDLAMASLAVGNKSVVALNLLSKALMRLRDFPAALQVLERANGISPDMVERLCAIAETQSELGNESAAATSLEAATKIDVDNQAVINTSVNIGLATGNAALAGEMITRVRPSDSVLAYVNNRAVAFAKAARYNDSIDLYNNALAAIPDDRLDLEAIVRYNLALAQIQNGDANTALKTLQGIRQAEDVDLAGKISSLTRRTAEALAAGKEMKLNKAPAKPQPKPGTQPSAKFAKLIAGFVATPPVALASPKPRCLAGIYIETAGTSPLVEALLDDGGVSTKKKPA